MLLQKSGGHDAQLGKSAVRASSGLVADRENCSAYQQVAVTRSVAGRVARLRAIGHKPAASAADDASVRLSRVSRFSNDIKYTVS